ncbi:hypothetical protein DMENIID0001_167350 [Sergentomyia squamirostris]
MNRCVCMKFHGGDLDWIDDDDGGGAMEKGTFVLWDFFRHELHKIFVHWQSHQEEFALCLPCTNFPSREIHRELNNLFCFCTRRFFLHFSSTPFFTRLLAGDLLSSKKKNKKMMHS